MHAIMVFVLFVFSSGNDEYTGRVCMAVTPDTFILAVCGVIAFYILFAVFKQKWKKSLVEYCDAYLSVSATRRASLR